ncbi:MAG: hypothetical protein AAGG69_15650 [Pseudomonadota bacterium]
MTRLSFAIALACVISLSASQAKASSIMCDPAWLLGGVLTYQETLTGIIALAEGNAPFAGDGAEERVCPKLETFRLYVNAGCISKTDQPRVEEAFEPFDCG